MDNTTQDPLTEGELRFLDTILNFGKNPYVEAVCIGKPLGLPEYDMDAEQWSVYFEESPTPWHPDATRDIVAVPCIDAEEATDIYNHYNKNPIMEEKQNDQVAS